MQGRAARKGGLKNWKVPSFNGVLMEFVPCLKDLIELSLHTAVCLYHPEFSLGVIQN